MYEINSSVSAALSQKTLVSPTGNLVKFSENSHEKYSIVRNAMMCDV